MILKTIQPLEILQFLNNPECKEVFAIPFHEDGQEWDMFKAYKWMKSKMPDSHIELNTLFWAWEYESENNKRQADEILKNDSLLGGVELTINKPIEQLLLSDVNNWLYGLNYFYLPDNFEDSVNYENLIKSSPEANYFEYKPLKDVNMHQKVLDSWNKIFEIKKNDITGNYEYKDKESFLKHMEIDKTDVLVQACFWSFTPEEVIDIKIHIKK